MEKIKALFKKVVEFLNKVLAFLKKAVAAIKKYGFGTVNFLVLLMLYGVAYFYVNTKGFILMIGGLWIGFLVGRFMYKVYMKEIFNKDEEEPRLPL